MYVYNENTIQSSKKYVFVGTRWRSALQAGRSRVRFPILSLEFFIDINSSGRTVAIGSSQRLTEMSFKNISWGIKAAGA